jgi:hypothetical protein
VTAPGLGEGLGLPPGAGEPAGAAEGSGVPPGAGEPTGAAVVVRPGRREEIAEVLGVWREAGSVPSVSDDPAVALRLAAGYHHDTRVGRYVRTLP